MRLDDGTIVESASASDPLEIQMGNQDVFPAFEQALMDHQEGETISFEVLPGDAFGDPSDELVQRLPRAAFEGGEQIEDGGAYTTETDDGVTLHFVAQETDDESIVADFNHPLAGQRLTFQVRILEIQ